MDTLTTDRPPACPVERDALAGAQQRSAPSEVMGALVRAGVFVNKARADQHDRPGHL